MDHKVNIRSAGSSNAMKTRRSTVSTTARPVIEAEQGEERQTSPVCLASHIERANVSPWRADRGTVGRRGGDKGQARRLSDLGIWTLILLEFVMS